MITLITGEPGNGKTAYAVSELLRLQDAGDTRLIYVWGVRELGIPHLKCPPAAEWTVLAEHLEDQSLRRPRLAFPDGALIVVDEAQDLFRPRAPGARVPPVVEALETHRHFGHDIWLITQKPSQLDSAVRGLIGRHIHIYRHFLGRRVLEWTTARDPSSKADRSEAAKVPFRLPRKALTSYKSATEHLSHRNRIPFAVFGLAGAALVVVGGWFVFSGIFDRHGGIVEQPLPKAPVSPEPMPKQASPARVQAPELFIVGRIFVKVGSKTVRDQVYVEDQDGNRDVVNGSLCAGDPLICDIDGSRVRLRKVSSRVTDKM